MRSSGGITHDGDQYELDLYPGVPWDGRSARALTKVGKGLFLRQEPPGREVYRDATQLDFFALARQAVRIEGLPQKYEGAPSLLVFPFDREGRVL